MHAVVATYGGSGYRGPSGWIQLVTAKYYDTVDQDAAAVETTFIRWRLPPIRERPRPLSRVAGA